MENSNIKRFKEIKSQVEKKFKSTDFAELQNRLNEDLHYLNELSEDLLDLFNNLHENQNELEKRNKILKESKEALTKEHQKYTDLFDFAPVGYVTLNEKGNIIEANRTFSELIDIDTKQLINSDFLSFVDNEFAKKLTAKCLSIKKGSEKETCELRLKSGKDKYFDVFLEIVPGHLDADNKLTKRISISDISEIKAAENQLKASENLYHTTINSINYYIHVVNTNLEIILANKASSDFLKDISVNNDILGKKVKEAFPFLQDRVINEYKYVFDTGDELITEDSIVFNNKAFYTETKKTPVIHNGKVIRVITTILDITERKRIENELRYKNNFLNLLLETVPYPVFYKNNKGVYTLCNKAFEDFIGINREKILGKTILDLYKDDPYSQVYHEADIDLMKTKETQTYETKVKHSDGTYHDVIFNKSIFIDNHEVKGIVGSIIDITERKKYEKTLIESEKRYRQLFNAMLDAFVLVEVHQDEKSGKAHFKILNVNPAFEQLTETKFEDIENQFVHKVFPGLKERYVQLVNEIATNKEAIRCEFSFPEFDKHVKAVFFIPQEGQLAVIISDITEQKKTEIALRKRETMLKASQERFKQIVDYTIDWETFREKGVLVYISPAFERITGYKTDKYINGEISLRDFVHEDDYDRIDNLLKAAKNGKTFNDIDCRIIRKDGILIYASVSMQPVFDSQNRFIGYRSSVRDITERKKTEIELRKKIEELTKELENRND